MDSGVSKNRVTIWQKETTKEQVERTVPEIQPSITSPAATVKVANLVSKAQSEAALANNQCLISE